MLTQNDRRYDHEQCLRKAKCYIDRTVNPPVIRVMKGDDDYEIVGWVWLTSYGELKSYGVNVVEGDIRYFIYNNKKFPPGVYYLIHRRDREMLVSESTLGIWNEYSIFCVIEESLPSSFNSTRFNGKN